MPKWMRIIIGSGIALLSCAVYLWFFGVQTMFALEARNIARKFPVVKNTPIELPDLSLSESPGKKLSYFGYEFEVPWEDIDQTKSRVVRGNKAVVAFRSGNVLMVWKGSPHDLVNTVLKTGKIDPETFRKLYGDESLESDFNFQRIMLETTPDTITPFVSKKQAVSQSMLLLMKGIAAPRGAESGIFAVTAGEFKGFQFGRPLSARSGFDVELYSESDSLDFIFAPKVNGPTAISQQDVNRILHTLHRAPAEAIANVTSSD